MPTFSLSKFLPLLLAFCLCASALMPCHAQTAKPAYPSTSNATDPLGTGLLADYVLNEGSGAVAHSSLGTGKDLAWFDDSGNASQPAPAWVTGGVDTTKGHFELTTGQSSNLQPAFATAGITFEVRYKFTGSAGGQFQWLSVEGANGCNVYGSLKYNGGSSSIFSVESGCSVNASCIYNSGANYAAGDHDLVGVISPAGAMTLYLDGNLVASGTRTGPLQTDASNHLVIGKSFPGVIEVCRQWGKALSPAQATSLYAAPYPTSLYGAASGTLTVQTPAMTSTSNTSLSLATTIAGGTAPLSYQWSRATSSVGPFVNLAGATSATLTDTPPTKAVYYYKLTVTDSATTPNVVTTSMASGVLYSAAKLVIGYIGDSITTIVGAFGTVAQEISRRVGQIIGIRQCTAINDAVSGSTTGNWIVGTSYYNTALADFQAGGVSIVNIELGTNGGSLADLLNIANGMQSNGFKVFIQGAPYNAGLATSDRLQQLNNSIAGVTDTATIKTSKTAPLFTFISQNLNQLADGTHPNSQGVDSFANIEAAEIAAAYFPTTAPAVGGATVFSSGGGQIKRGR